MPSGIAVSPAVAAPTCRRVPKASVTPLPVDGSSARLVAVRDAPPASDNLPPSTRFTAASDENDAPSVTLTVPFETVSLPTVSDAPLEKVKELYWKYVLKAVVFYGIVLVRDSLFQFMSLVLMGVKDERDIQKGEEVKTQENI